MASIDIASDVLDELENCPKHPNEKIKHYCRAHEKIGCLTCMAMFHKLCEFDEIEKISEKFTQYEEYTNFENCIKYISDTCEENVSKLEGEIESVETAYNTAISAIKKRRRYLNDILDDFQSALEHKVKAFKEENQMPKESMKAKYESIANEIENTRLLTSQLKQDKRYKRLFCEMKMARKCISTYQTDIYNLASSHRKQECKFIESINLESFFESFFTEENLFGKFGIEDIKLGPCNTLEKLEKQSVCHINIKHHDDKKDCHATGLAFISCDQLAVADKANKSVKIIDVSYDKVLAEITLSSGPFDVTVMPPHQLAASLYDEKLIQLLSFEKGLSKSGQIKTHGHCSGIRYNDGNLIVTYADSKAQIIDVLTPKGDILNTIKCKREELRLREPNCIGLSPNAKHLYVSDRKIGSVYRISLESGEITNVGRVRDVMGIAVSERGTVFVCSKSEDIVYQSNDDLTNGHMVLGKANGIKGPIALALNHAKSQLVVSCLQGESGARDKLHVFKITFDS